MLHERIISILKNKPKTRDNDLSLLFNIWMQELPDYLQDDGNRVFGHLYTYGCTKPESVVRCRRKVQERELELRGELYNKRQEKSKSVQKAMRENPGYTEIEKVLL